MIASEHLGEDLGKLLHDAVEITRQFIGRGTMTLVFCQNEDGEGFILEPRNISADDVYASLSKALEKFSVVRYVFFMRGPGLYGRPAQDFVLDASVSEVLVEDSQEGVFNVFYGEERDSREELCILFNEDFSEKLVDGAQFINLPRFFPARSTALLN